MRRKWRKINRRGSAADKVRNRMRGSRREQDSVAKVAGRDESQIISIRVAANYRQGVRGARS
jgi:hypothetical protein